MKHRTAMLAALLASIPGAAFIHGSINGPSEVRALSAAQERQASAPNQAATVNKAAARMSVGGMFHPRRYKPLGLVKGKPGAAALKRAAKKRANVRARSPMARKGKG